MNHELIAQRLFDSFGFSAVDVADDILKQMPNDCTIVKKLIINKIKIEIEEVYQLEKDGILS
jgi:hypothetical protein